MSSIHFKRLHPEAILPTRATPGSAGLDLYACHDPLVSKWLTPCVVLAPGERRMVSTGWAVDIPYGFEGQVRPRSGLALREGLTVLNSPGTIDSDYRGELCVLLINFGTEPVVIRQGDRIAQLVIAPVAMTEAIEVDALPESERGAGGFGSTGVTGG
jgi:dUTP pyrophosphatase